MPPPSTAWSAAIFAHNVAGSIEGCLKSVLSQQGDSPGQICVLVNGSKDATQGIVAEFASAHPNVTLVALSLADKANAWNHYVHVLKPAGDFHFFVDGDVSVTPNAFNALSQALINAPGANAAGALPVSGRDRIGWSRRMTTFGRLAGGLYALRGSFVTDLQHRDLRIPVGLIGEDLLLSCLAKGMLNPRGLVQASPRLVFAAEAGFAFESLSKTRPGDWIKYARRLVRYQVRDYQMAMLLNLLATQPQSGLPPDSETLYLRAADLPGYYWRGWITPFDLLAVIRIRRTARKRGRRD